MSNHTMKNEQMTLEQARDDVCEWLDANQAAAKRTMQLTIGPSTHRAMSVLLAHTAQPAEVEKTMPAIDSALAYSRNFAEASPYLTKTAKEHILGLCNLLEAREAKRHAASVAGQPCPHIVTSPGGSSFCRLAESAQPASAQAEPVGTVTNFDCTTGPSVSGVIWVGKKPATGTGVYLAPPPATSREVPEGVLKMLSVIEEGEQHDANGPGRVYCPACDAETSMVWSNGHRVLEREVIQHRQHCPAEWARSVLAAAPAAPKEVQ